MTAAEILAAWDRAVVLHREYWMNIGPGKRVSAELRQRDLEASVAVVRLGLACPDAVAAGGPR